MESTCVPRHFVHNPLPTCLRDVPGVDEVAERIFARYSITRVDHLVAVFFALERDESAFLAYLLRLGIARDTAQGMAQAFRLKCCGF